MRKILSLSVLAVTMACAPLAAHAGMSLTSLAFEDGATLPNAQVFKGFGCDGENQSPALSWSGAPEGTKSFALMVHDPDAPTGGAGWWHWVVVDIPASVDSLPAGASQSDVMPDGAWEGPSDFGYAGYGGACPPEGQDPHHYNFTIHALDVDSLPVGAESSASLIGFMVNAHTLDKATLTGMYGH